MDTSQYTIDYLRDLIKVGPSVLPWDIKRLPDLPGYRWRQEGNSIYLDLLATGRSVAGPVPAYETNLMPIGSDKLAYWHYGFEDQGVRLAFVDLRTGNIEYLCLPDRDPGEFSVEPLVSVAPEVELLFPMSRSGTAINYVIYSLKPHFGTARVTEIEWFNKSNPDPGYQWVVKVVREPGTGNIVGCGFRIPMFVLDPTGHDLICLVPT